MIDAAVLIPVYRSQDNELHIVMILRNPVGVHGGQIAFPGGKRDPEDGTMLDTALREVREELGLIVERNDVLAELPMEQSNERLSGVSISSAHQRAEAVAGSRSARSQKSMGFSSLQYRNRGSA